MNDRERLESLYDDFAHRIYAYAVRHCGPVDADDVLSETFVIAWRRIDVIPAHSLPWLLATAANLIRNGRRANGRRSDTVRRLTALYADERAPVDDAIMERQHVLEILAGLTGLEREALLLIAWDGLDIAGAAGVAGCAPRAFRARLARARARVAAGLSSSPRNSSELPSAAVPKETPS